MSRRREALEIAAAIEISTRQHDTMIDGPSSVTMPLSEEQIINSKDLELVEGSTIVMALERQAEDEVVADSEDEEEISVLKLSGSKPPLGPNLNDPNALSSIDSFTPSNLPAKAPAVELSAVQTSSSGNHPVNLIPDIPTSPVAPTISPTIIQTLPSPRSSPAPWQPLEPPSLPLKSRTNAKLSSRKSISPASNEPPASSSKPKHARTNRKPVILSSDGESESETAAVPLEPYHNAPESSSAASKRTQKRVSRVVSDDEVEASSAPVAKKRSKVHNEPPSRSRSSHPASSPDPLEMGPGPSVASSGDEHRKRSSPRSAVTAIAENVGETPEAAPLEAEEIVLETAVQAEAAPPSTAKGKKGKAAAKPKKAKATPKGRKAKGKQAQSAEMIEDEGEVPPPSAPVEPVETAQPQQSEEVAPEMPPEPDAPLAKPSSPEPVRRPLEPISNRVHTPTRERLHSDSPGPSKLGVGAVRTPQGLPLGNAMFGGARRSGFSKRSRLPSLHTKIKTPPKALPPAPIKPVRKKKGDESESDEEEVDQDGNVIKKAKVKGIEWYMMED